MEVIAVENLQKTFGTLEVIKDISFSVNKGEVLGIIGPSGSGKSTILRCITQLERVTSGTIRICGDVLVTDIEHKGKPQSQYADKESQRQIGLKAGLVFQNFNLFPHFTVLRNITEAQVRVLNRTQKEAEDAALVLLEKMSLSSKAQAYPCELSGGQMQRVSIARALALNPEVLFFDEPTSALDPELTGEILKVIRALADEKKTMVVVTHQMAFARDLCDRVIFMDNGIIVEQGNSQDIINNPSHERTKAFLSRFQ